jgi:hypothetical protein
LPRDGSDIRHLAGITFMISGKIFNIVVLCTASTSYIIYTFGSEDPSIKSLRSCALTWKQLTATG